MKFLIRFILPIIAILMMIFTASQFVKNKDKNIDNSNEKKITGSVFNRNIYGVGISTPESEVINLGVDISGIVKKVYVNSGDKVKKGDKLFLIENEESKKNLILKNVKYEMAKIEMQEKAKEFRMYKKINDKRAYSKNEFNKKKLSYDIAVKNVKQTKIDADIAKIHLEKFTIKSPIDGEVLKANVRVGEFVSNQKDNNLILIGNLEKMHVEVEIDQLDILNFDETKPAIAFIRGRSDIKIPLTFVRSEKIALPKASITNNISEKIDTRVVKITYSFDNLIDLKILPGQELDIYIGLDE